jgi:hypothetical protein
MEVLQSHILSSMEFSGKTQSEVGEAQTLHSPHKKNAFERNQTPDIKLSQQKFMAAYKVSECKKKFNHDKRQCLNWHSQADRRRNPYVLKYVTNEVCRL